jgi:2-polyprenyl-6-methoxyphenol hydroxylase-like FAD-dependent oxidoreductase
MAYQVVVIGAGFGGIGMAIALKQAGIDDFVVLDRAGDLGGTWRFPPLEEILAYLHALVAERDLSPHLQFGGSVAAGGSEKHRQLESARSTRAW